MNTLLSLQLYGGFWTVFLFGVCFLGVHLIKLAEAGWQASKKKEPPKPEPPPEKKKTPPKQEPIYYLVEKKKRKKEE